MTAGASPSRTHAGLFRLTRLGDAFHPLGGMDGRQIAALNFRVRVIGYQLDWDMANPHGPGI